MQKYRFFPATWLQTNGNENFSQFPECNTKSKFFFNSVAFYNPSTKTTLILSLPPASLAALTNV